MAGADVAGTGTGIGIGTGMGTEGVAARTPVGTRGAVAVETEAGGAEGAATGGGRERAAGGMAAAQGRMLADGTTLGLETGSRGTVAETTTGTKGA